MTLSSILRCLLSTFAPRVTISEAYTWLRCLCMADVLPPPRFTRPLPGGQSLHSANSASSLSTVCIVIPYTSTYLRGLRLLGGKLVRGTAGAVADLPSAAGATS
ncbi:unnamed protein product, partial [Ectocarpus sp. 4 AP-2014]